eukprot:Nitzschia sp. Nitz4//scaffold269_size25945//9125//11428//NITZ4_008288-RA/size25945-processed-gene-0.2-mRNA-1//1//CDS//3329544964//6888//frame0
MSGSPMDGNGSGGSSSETNQYVRYPILIFPGFMSSGLEIRESVFYPDWEGKRLWLNLASLGVERLTKVASKPWDKVRDTMVPGSSSAAYTTASEQQGVSFPPAHSIKGPANPRDSVTVDLQKMDPSQASSRSVWLSHMLLDASDLCTEPEGVQVRAIPGLDGVDYLYPSFLTNMVTYVFGPLIDFLIQEGGYVRDVNLQAAPWDWRLPPRELERRDSYFTKAMLQIETMYEMNNGLPIVLLGHSLGGKVIQYLLNFALEEKGQAWIDKHVYAYVPVSATHTGVPKAIKQVVLVDHSCLDPFLTFEEEVAFGRCMGSTPWMFPTELPPHVPPVAFVKRQGILRVSVSLPLSVRTLVQSRRAADRPIHFQLQVALGDPKSPSNTIRLLSSEFLEVRADGKADFSSETFFFVTPPDCLSLSNDPLTLQLYLREPGWVKSSKDKVVKYTSGGISAPEKDREVHVAKKPGPIAQLANLFASLFCCVFDLVIFPLDLLNKMTIETSSVLGVSEAISLETMEPNEVKTHTVELTHIMDSQRRGCFSSSTEGNTEARTIPLEFEVLWKPFNASFSPPKLCSAVASPNAKNPPHIQIANETSGKTYLGMSGHDFMYREGGTRSFLQSVESLYDSDPLGPRSRSAIDAPPVKRVHAIYGINIPTEIGALYERTDACYSTRRYLPLHQLDATGAFVQQQDKKHDNIEIRDCLVFEVPTQEKPTGDGTVPYSCLATVKAWGSPSLELSVFEIPNAEHREILSNKDFQYEILRYCRRSKT